MMTLVVYPITAASIMVYTLRSQKAPEFFLGILRNLFLNDPDQVSWSAEEAGTAREIADDLPSPLLVNQ